MIDVVLLHGFAAGPFTWRRIVPALAIAHRVTVLDRSWAPLSASVEATRAAIAGMPTVVLIGHSAGAEIAMHVAVAEPERVSALVLIAPVAGVGPPPFVRVVAGIPGTARLAGPLLRAGRPLFGRAFARAWSDRSNLTADVIDGYRRPLLEPGVTETISAMTANPPTAALPLPPHILTLVLVGEDDRWTVRVEGGRQTLVRYPGCGHLPHEERPDDVIETIRGFLGR